MRVLTDPDNIVPLLLVALAIAVAVVLWRLRARMVKLSLIHI